MNKFPQKVWDWETTDHTGRPLWFSRPATYHDTVRRNNLLQDFWERQEAKEQKPPDRILRREG